MIEELQQFGSLSVAHRTGGAVVELVRSKDEVVFLAFDNRIHRLVELHVLRGGSTLDAAMKKSAFERARQASEIRGHAFMRILEVGEDQGLVYYTSNLNDGEFVEHYTQRRGAVAPATALALVYQLLDDLLQLQGFERLVSRMHLDRVLVTTLEDTFLQLRVFDYGLSQMDAGTEVQSGGRLVVEASRLIFLLLTGQPYAGENPDRFPALTQLPMGLRTAVRAALTDPVNAPTSIEKLRDDVREAFSALSSNIKARNFRKHLVVSSSLLPQSQLQELLLEDVPVETILGTRFRVEDVEHARRYPFSIPAINTKLGQEVTVHLLPPSRIVDKSRYEAVPLQMWRFNPERHPNILRSLSLWESPDWTFLTEEREPGFALSRLMAERITLNPAEVTVLMRQIRAGLDQAVECGVQRVDLHPSNILLRVGKNGPLLSRELERLMQKRLDAWPSFVVKLRPHMTMRSLYEPLLVDMDLAEGPLQEEHLQNRDFRHRSFVALAGYLLTGERLGAGVPMFPEAIPEAAATYVRECLELTRRAGKTPSPGDFINKFEGLLSAPTVDLATRLRGGRTVALEEMESVGSVSDFEDDWNANDAGGQASAPEVISPIRRGIKTHDFNTLLQPKRSLPWGAMAAAAVVVLGFGAWIFTGSKNEPGAVAQSGVPSSAKAEGPAAGKGDSVPPVVAKVKVIENKPAAVQTQAVRPETAPVPAKPVKAVAVMKQAVPNPAPAVADAAPSLPVKPALTEVKAEPSPAMKPAPAVADAAPSLPVKPVLAEVKTEPSPAVKPAPAVADAAPSLPVKPAPAEAKAEPSPVMKPAPAVADATPSRPVKSVLAEVRAETNPVMKPAPAVADAAPSLPAKPAPAEAKAETNLTVKPSAAVVATTAVAPASSPKAAEAVDEVKPMEKTAADKPESTAAKTVAVTSVPASPQPPMAPPVNAPIIIRRAILPSKEEIDRMKQGQVVNRTGEVPSIYTASPLKPKR